MSESAFLSAQVISCDGTSRPLKQHELNYTCQNNEYLWLHVQCDAPDADTVLSAVTLDDGIADALCTPETRPRAMHINNGALIYLRGINRNPEADPEDMVSLRVWCQQHLVVTARRKHRRLVSVQELQDAVVAQKAPPTPNSLLLDIVTRVADKIHDTVDEIDDALVSFEEDINLDKKDRQTLAALRRQAASIRRFLAPQRDALDALFRFPQFLQQDEAFTLREQTDRITRYVEDLDLARERAVVLQDELRNRVADQQGMRMYVLSMVTAIFLPLSFLTGVFGMNVGGLPGTDSPTAFAYLMGAMGILAVIMLIAMLWRRWL
ncbi:zinc transporter ZntB [Aestuariibacter sp. A3R04]|uniref:zinc transporter ZntB n=1 Tax=Aestuariibacter sp. A3R04 TaxID=2841571 RepID=UPI001C09A8B6|nr:zinc transporter ZntB [Aestuariibacter sp. A3R04]MBU3023690.1 zinc transporter ZntB [Aestuariibacter sp. A3R04]